MATLESILHDALELPLPERGRLLRSLIESLDQEEALCDDAWADEIARRIASVDAGHGRIVDAKAAIASARDALRLKVDEGLPPSEPRP